MSAIFTMMAAALIFLFLEQWLDSSLSALVSALAFGLSPLVWSQAVITEVYALHALLTTGIICVFLAPVRKPLLYLGQGILFGLAVGNHLTTLLLSPLVLLIQLEDKEGDRIPQDVLRKIILPIAFRFLGVLIGLLVYVVLPLRASAWPPVNWGNPVTLDSFFWLVSAQIYQEFALSLSVLETIQRFQGLAGLLFHQFTFIGLILGLYGLFSNTSSAARLSTIWVFVSFNLFAIFYAYADSFVYVIPASISFSMWIGIGLHDLLAVVSSRRNRIRSALLLALLAGIIVRSLWILPEVDASKDQRAEIFGEKLLASAPKDAIVVTDTDEETFALWYFHYALRQRPDLMVISEGLLQFDWYYQTLQETYPGLVIPEYESFTTAQEVVDANPSNPVCFATYQGVDVLVCDETILSDSDATYHDSLSIIP